MSFEIKLRGRIGAALQDLVREETARTLQLLGMANPASEIEAIHETRKQIKKLRAILVLLREPLGKKRYQEEEAVLRKIGHQLGPKRDAEVLLKTLQHLQHRFFPERPSPVIRTLREAFVARERRCLAQLVRSNAAAAIGADLQEMLVRLPDWPVADYGWKDLRRAVRRSYERARAGYRKAHDTPSSPRLHLWRKRVKDLWFHLRLLRRACPARMEELAQDFEVLGEFLGDDHDLSLLKSALEERRATHSQRAAMETLFELIDLRREELLDPAFDLGARLHEESATEFVREIHEQRATHHERVRKAKKLGQRLAAA